ncbi:hypothetical protein RHGRI_001124 [Rhododendron griersonianum]|uniref:mitogen-activated protein kinase kinase n=1 Tax=Rhododendron griersonianum TaxID=479676 RepID=A0AAV6LK39_9ERIC|nr:hypothetical protein RHGRI_001124 [Rhododendron griersonianum]
MEVGSKSSQQRGPAFSLEEDKILCNTWLEISQDPIKGVNQKKDKLWERITATFHARRSGNYIIARSAKSLQCRMTLISKAISKFRGGVRSIENLNPSDASETDIDVVELFIMAGLEELKKKLTPLFDAEKGFSSGSTLDPCDSYTLSDSRTVNLLSRSYGVYNINELGLQKCTSWPTDDLDHGEKTYKCASHEKRIFGAIGSGASSVVQRAIHIPTHRILALKKINIFEKEKREQLLTEIRTLCEAPCYQGLVEFHGAFYTPDSGQISNSFGVHGWRSLADVIRVQNCIPEPVLSSMFQKLLHGLSYLHGVRHLVHRDIKPANLLVNLKGEPKITDFGISAGLENSMAMCATFVGTVTYMSPERIRNESYSYPADIWSLGLALFECGTGEFPYTANEGPVNLMLQILDDPSPSPPNHVFSPEFCSFIDACLKKDANSRPTAEQLLSRPFITKYEDARVDLGAFVRRSNSAYEGFGRYGVQPEGLPNFKDLSIDMSRRRMGTFQEQFIMEPGNVIGRDLCEEGEGLLNCIGCEALDYVFTSPTT